MYDFLKNSLNFFDLCEIKFNSKENSGSATFLITVYFCDCVFVSDLPESPISIHDMHNQSADC